MKSLKLKLVIILLLGTTTFAFMNCSKDRSGSSTDPGTIGAIGSGDQFNPGGSCEVPQGLCHDGSVNGCFDFQMRDIALAGSTYFDSNDDFHIGGNMTMTQLQANSSGGLGPTAIQAAGARATFFSTDGYLAFRVDVPDRMPDRCYTLNSEQEFPSYFNRLETSWMDLVARHGYSPNHAYSTGFQEQTRRRGFYPAGDILRFELRVYRANNPTNLPFFTKVFALRRGGCTQPIVVPVPNDNGQYDIQLEAVSSDYACRYYHEVADPENTQNAAMYCPAEEPLGNIKSVCWGARLYIANTATKRFSETGL